MSQFRFYDEIGTPLLSDIRINYTEDSVRYVTQHLFTNYFNGSEMVIAGKLANQSVESLHVQVTASNNDRSIVLETDVPLKHREMETEKHVKAATAAMANTSKTPGSTATKASQASQGVGLGLIAQDFVERVWGFLSVKEGLRSRLRSQTSKEREDHIQQATNLSMTYHFLTPLTNLVVEKPEVLANGTMAPAPTIPPAANKDKPSSSFSPANELPGDREDEKPQNPDKRKPGRPSSSLSNAQGTFFSLEYDYFTGKETDQ